MSGWDADRISYSNQNLVAAAPEVAPAIDLDTARARFREFIRTFRVNNVFPYREQLVSRWNKHEHYIEVDLTHLQSFDEDLQDMLQLHPADLLPMFEAAAKDALHTLVGSDDPIPDFQVTLRSNQGLTAIRSITAAEVNRLVRVPGIVISASRTRPKATHITISCKGCGNTKTMAVSPAFGHVALPRTCDSSQSQQRYGGEKCPLDPYVIVADRSGYVDQQTLKLQEAPEVVPTGEMPRHTLLSVDRHLSDRVAPGTRVNVLGIASVHEGGKRQAGAVAIRTPYLRVVGLEVDGDGAGRGTSSFTPAEEARFTEMAREEGIYDKLCRSIAPSIWGDYADDIKKAVACLLMAGSRKVLPDGMRLRGDINVLLLGDPSTAKSQFLKFTEKVSPVGVYTSGKGSSAAGLTASVVRDARGEFYLEGGAMVLADGGVVCIDEFDKMRETDRVAIHEAMEQQTISIAKAGITTILNSRAAVLAAANPVFGRYDDDRTAAENIDFLPTILSRFDLIFIVRDVRDQERDRNIARHVMGVHINASSGASTALEEGEVDLATMKRYIAYCRAKCAPRLSVEAADILRSHYVKIREEVRAQAERLGDTAPPVPITVRQLEAIVRISEALAKMSLSIEATPEHVNEAIRLFKVSTLNAAHAGVLTGEGGGPETMQRVQQVEDVLKRRVGVGARASTQKTIQMFTRMQGMEEVVVRKAIAVLVARGEFQFERQKRVLRRVR